MKKMLPYQEAWGKNPSTVKRDVRVMTSGRRAEKTHWLLAGVIAGALRVKHQAVKIPGHNAHSLAAMFRRHGFQARAYRQKIHGQVELLGKWSIEVL